MPRRPLHLLGTVVLLGASALAGCGGGEPSEAGTNGKPPDATLSFEGYVYVDFATSDFKILERVRQETLSAFRGLRKARVMVSRRDVERPDPGVFSKEAVTVVDAATGVRTPALRVRYRYVARPDVAPEIDGKTEIATGLLHRTRDVDPQRVLRECSASTPQQQEYERSLAPVFDSSLETCKEAMRGEQAAIDAARAAIPARRGALDADEIPREERERIYLPVTATLEVRAPAPGEKLPRYERVDGAQDAAAAVRAEPGERDPTLQPAQVIVDPDLPAQHKGEALAQPGQSAAAGQAAGAAPEAAAPGADGKPLPEVVAPAAAQAPKKEALGDRLELAFETVFDLKYLAVWLSLLMVIPILRGERHKRA